MPCRVAIPALALLAGCETAAPPPALPASAQTPVIGGPPERVEDCAFEAGIAGEFETLSSYDQGVVTVSIIAGRNVNSDQADRANACLARPS